MHQTKAHWTLSRRTLTIRKRTRCRVFTIALLLAVYGAVTTILSLTKEDVYSERPLDWKLVPHELLTLPQDIEKESTRSLPSPRSVIRDGSVRNLSTDTASDSHIAFFGFVMRDFAQRVLSRHISSSNVLVIAPDATRAAQDGMQTRNQPHRVDARSPYSIGGTFLLHAAREGHHLHAFDYGVEKDGTIVEWNQTLDDWWTSFEDPSRTHGGTRMWSSSKTTPKWIIAAIFDHFHPKKLEAVDQIWFGSERFLNESTMTYVVVAMHSRKRRERYEFGGLGAAKALLDHRYKLQVLQLSHYHTEPGHEAWTEAKYGPNALFKSLDNIQELLRWGADTAASYETGNDNNLFTAYIFATQGLDLAIPSNRIFIDDNSRVIGKESTLQINLYKPLQFKDCPQATMEPKLDIAFAELLGETSITVTIPIANATPQVRHYHPRASPDLGFTYQYTKPEEQFRGPRPEDVVLWVSNSDFNKAEAACARFSDYSKCITRVIENNVESKAEDWRQRETFPNVLLIMIDPISRPHFQRTMPRTAKALDKLGFIHFGNYTAIGPNSGKNQAALYSGMLLADRDGIKKDTDGGKWLWDRLRDQGYVTLKAEDGCVENSNMLKSLEPNTTHGHDLTKLFCFDFDRPNCLGPDLAARHLIQYGQNFIATYENRRTRFDPFVRWAAFLHFIDTHEDTMVLSSMLDAEISSFISRLGNVASLDNTAVILTSDHGLHYGPYYQSRSGRREATQPLLYIRVPASIQSRKNMKVFMKNAEAWTTAFDVHETLLSLTTPANDLGGARMGLSLFNPFPEYRMSCKGSKDIPSKYCALSQNFDSADSQPYHGCTKMPRPPNVLSFYSDLPPNKRTTFPLDCTPMSNKTGSIASLSSRCQCATSHRGWYRCVEHPWGPDEVHSKRNPEEYFALVKCRGQKMSIDTRVTLNEEHLREIHRRKLSGSSTSPPNVVFIEVDSVSVAYADRHLPQTQAFLKRYKMRKSPNGEIECSNGVCSPEFKYFSLNGPNSVANQIAALSGCVVARFHERCFSSEVKLQQDECSRGGMFTSLSGVCLACPQGSFLADPLSTCKSDVDTDCCTRNFPAVNASRICQDPSRYEFGLQLFRRGPRRHATFCQTSDEHTDKLLESPWLFDVAKKFGYVTFFGDEFCYVGSPFVAQNNIFPLSPDYELQKLYCRLKESRQYTFSALGPRLCASQRIASGTKPMNPGFDLIREIWQVDELKGAPKFMYLNAMAAHDYDSNWIKMVAVAEEYDGQLAAFLSRMVNHQSFSNTIIVLRSDHGLQGGPMTMEYAMQVEHREPWAYLLLPQALVGDSLKSLFVNQDRIVTGHDLYQSLLKMMMVGLPNDERAKHLSAVPAWSYNLLHDVVPETRSCKDAKVPEQYCLCEEQVEYRPPSLGVCNTFDQYGDLFCPDHHEVMLPDVLEV